MDQPATGSEFLGVHDFPEWIPVAGEVVATSVAVGVHCGQGEPRVVLGVALAVTASGSTSPIISQITVRRNRGAGGECQGFLKLQHHGLGLLTSPEPVRMVGPLLHHLSPFRQVRRSLNSLPLSIPHSVSQLVLNEVRTKSQHFIQEGPCRGSKSMPAHFFLADTFCARVRLGLRCRSWDGLPSARGRLHRRRVCASERVC